MPWHAIRLHNVRLSNRRHGSSSPSMKPRHSQPKSRLPEIELLRFEFEHMTKTIETDTTNHETNMLKQS